ncbi:MAG: hypothetical protein ACRYGR_01590 [Janthinobacterium lividum]
MTETLEWRTLISKTLSGAEQRIATRQYPRRTYEFTVIEWQAERAKIEMFLRLFGAYNFYVPMWADAAPLLEVNYGQDLLAVDWRGMNFYSTQGSQLGLLIVWANSASYEILEIVSIDDDGITVDAGGSTWPIGTLVMPLQLMRFADTPSQTLVSAVVSSGTFSFVSAEAAFISTQTIFSSYQALLTGGLTFDNLPVYNVAPNDLDGPQNTYDRDTVELDSNTGLDRIIDVSGNSYRHQNYTAFITSPLLLGGLRYLLYNTLRGRQGAIWMPTFAADFIIAADMINQYLNVYDTKYTSYASLGGPMLGMQHIRIVATGGRVFYFKILSSYQGGNLGTGYEVLVLNQGLVIPMTEVVMISLVSMMRLDQDATSIVHQMPGGGMALAQMNFVDVLANILGAG